MRKIILYDRSKSSLSVETRRDNLPSSVLSHCFSHSLKDDQLNSRIAYSLFYKFRKENKIPLNPIFFSKDGKPYRKNSLFFSISHSRNRIALLISSKECGIDIQEVQNKDFDSMSERVLSSREHSLYLKSKDKPSFFTSCWVRKEAYLKRIGTGITSLSGLKKIDENLAISSLLDSEGNKYYYSYIDI